MSKVSWFFIALAMLIGAIVLYNKVLYPSEKGTKGMGAKGAQPTAMAVNGFVVAPTTLNNSIVASGTLLASEEVELHPEMSGRITELHLDEGTSVSKGTLLVQLYDADLQAQLEKLQMQQVTAAKTADRLKKLLAINGVGQQEYDDAITQLNNLKADIDVVQAQITKMQIRAPFSGIVGLRNVSPGAFVSPSTIVATLQQIDPLKIDFTIPEKYAPAVSKGDDIQFTVDGFQTPLSGKVYAIEPRIDKDTRTLRIRALVRNAQAHLYPGAFAKVNLDLKSTANALMIPTQCIIPQARDKKVIVIKDGKAVFHTVETGVRDESYIQITDGIEAGDTVVTTGLMYLHPGSNIKISGLTK